MKNHRVNDYGTVAEILNTQGHIMSVVKVRESAMLSRVASSLALLNVSVEPAASLVMIKFISYTQSSDQV